MNFMLTHLYWTSKSPAISLSIASLLLSLDLNVNYWFLVLRCIARPQVLGNLFVHHALLGPLDGLVDRVLLGILGYDGRGERKVHVHTGRRGGLASLGFLLQTFFNLQDDVRIIAMRISGSGLLELGSGEESRGEILWSFRSDVS